MKNAKSKNKNFLIFFFYFQKSFGEFKNENKTTHGFFKVYFNRIKNIMIIVDAT